MVDFTNNRTGSKSGKENPLEKRKTETVTILVIKLPCFQFPINFSFPYKNEEYRKSHEDVIGVSVQPYCEFRSEEADHLQ